VLLDSSSGATRILVTHALHFLPKVDYIYFMIDGQIAERGTFEEMMANRGEFSRTFDEFVTKNQNDSEGEKVLGLENADLDENAKKRRAAARGAALMQAEERNTGAVKFQVYKRYFQSGNGAVLLPAMAVTIVLMEASVVLSSYWYGWSYHGTDRANANACTC
jgi:ABC-type multidrug transport system ATPase subunit